MPRRRRATRTEKEAYTKRKRRIPSRRDRRGSSSLYAKKKGHADREGGLHAWVALPLTRATGPHSVSRSLEAQAKNPEAPRLRLDAYAGLPYPHSVSCGR